MTAVRPAAHITPQQLADADMRAISYTRFVEGIPDRGDALREAYEAVYDAVSFTEDEKAAIARLSRSYRLLAIVEEFSPDVIANLPIFAHIAKRNPAITLRVLYRPDHQAVADAYPGPAKRSHIPTYVLFDEEGAELGVLVERPEAVDAYWLPFFTRALATVEDRFPGVERKDLPAALVAELMAEGLALRRQVRDIEQAGVVAWLTAAASIDSDAG